VIRPRRPNIYTGSRLDRAAHRRDDAAWIEAAVASATTMWVPVWRGRHLIRDGGRAEFVAGERAGALRAAGGAWAFLGTLDGSPLIATDVGAVEDPASLLPDEAASFVELRPVVGTLPAGEAAILAHARGVMHWRARHRFCGHCGAPLVARSGGNTLLCEACGTQHFPRTDPAVIMLVVRDDLALLAHSERFPTPTMYSTLAGFVEPGESLEEAVAREVFEEAGVRVDRVTYHSSQPWPFPASLMVGFHAQASDARITLDDDELTDARWFSRAEIRDPGAHGFMIPGVDSIARRLIEDWVDHE
jgi:NAD+ diphosphatase